MNNSLWSVNIWRVSSRNAWQLWKLPGEERFVTWEDGHETFSLCEKHRLPSSLYSENFCIPLGRKTDLCGCEAWKEVDHSVNSGCFESVVLLVTSLIMSAF